MTGPSSGAGRSAAGGVDRETRAAARRALAKRPSGVVYEAPPRICDGGADDLLTAGLGLAGLRADAPPPDASMRQRWRWRDFRELLDLSNAGGFGRLYGASDADLRIAGVEHAALLSLPGRPHAFATIVLIPDSFDAARPRLIVAPASGSRGVTGAIGDIGVWALTHGAALALTDKGCGVGAQDLASGRFIDLLGGVAEPDEDAPTIFRLPDLSVGAQAVALKHAHSGANVEADWGWCVLQTARYAMHLLSSKAAPEAVTVIAAGVSNGGTAVLRAAELDDVGLIDGVVAAEPNITPRLERPIPAVAAGVETSLTARPLYDYASELNLLAPPAGLAVGLQDDQLERWTEALTRSGRLGPGPAETRAAEALDAVTASGFSRRSAKLLHILVAGQIWPAITTTYANAYSRARPETPLAGVRFGMAAAQTGARAATCTDLRTLAATGQGLAPGGGLGLIYEDASGDPPEFIAAMAFRSVFETRSEAGARLRGGLSEVLASGDPKGRPTIILHGRDDPLISPSHASRAYTAAYWSRGRGETLRYFELDRVQHFDAFLADPTLAATFAPIAPYVEQALGMMLRDLEEGVVPPPSQVVRPAPRGSDGAGPNRLELHHLTPIRAEPGDDLIAWREGALRIP